LKAVVLVGGEGTRLRPLTETIPKPLLPVVNRPFLDHVLDHLLRHDVDEVILSSPYLESAFRPFIEGRRQSPRITWITEETRLGTGGAVVNAGPLVNETFLVLNGDILTDLDLTAMLGFHRRRGAVATIALTHVEDARPYGLVEIAEDGRVSAFREKPASLVPGDVNAGTYVLEPEALSGWEPDREISIEREIYPSLIERGDRVFGFLSTAYWMDLGTPQKYLEAQFDILLGRVAGYSLRAPLVAGSAHIDRTAEIGRRVVVGEEVVVAEGASISDSVLHDRARIGSHARVGACVVGAHAVVGAGAVLSGCVLAEGASVPEGLEARDLRVPPGEVAQAPALR
jgi:NDP-sugar pyrophosphorylase family protein